MFSWKELITDRLAEWPILRTLLLNPVFGLLIVVLGLVAFSVLVAIPRVWLSTPEGFRPIVRISLLDHVQAWSLRRTANRLMAAGDFEGEARARFAAAANHPGSLRLQREALFAYLRGRRDLGYSPERLADAIQWLLQLSNTTVDLHLAALIYDANGYTGEVLSLLEPRRDQLPRRLEAPFMKALFHAGRMREFGERWARSDFLATSDPQLQLYHEAWHAGWGNPGDQDRHLATLLEATSQLDQRLIANQLLLAVHAQRRDVEAYRRTLDRLQEFRGDTVSQHARYWILLQESGQEDRAQSLALAYPYRPSTPGQAVTLAQAFIALNRSEEAVRLLEGYGQTLGNLPAVHSLPYWTLLGELYARQGNWEQLMILGRNLQTLPNAQGTLRGFGHFLEGHGWFETGAPAAARDAFRLAINAGFATPEVSLEVALLLLRMDFPDLAQELLLPFESVLQESDRYWMAIFTAAFAQREDEALLFKAARRALDLSPNDPVRQANYAVALMIGRQRPDEAVRITFDYFHANPRSGLARLNHAYALAITGRTDDAAGLIRTLPIVGDPLIRTSHALVRLEIAAARLDSDGVQQALGDIDLALLFPPQRAWVQRIEQQFLLPGS